MSTNKDLTNNIMIQHVESKQNQKEKKKYE